MESTDSTPPEKEQSDGKEYCFVCGYAIDSHEFVRALDGIFHSNCFRCHSCQNLLKVGNVTVVDRKLHCHPTCQLPLVEPRNKAPMNAERPALTSAVYSDERTEKTVPVVKHRVSLSGSPRWSKTELNFLPREFETRERLERSKSLPVRSSDEDWCYACRTKIDQEERLETILGAYHISCFRCKLCNRLLDIKRYNIKEGHPCCQPDCRSHYKPGFYRPNHTVYLPAKLLNSQTYIATSTALQSSPTDKNDSLRQSINGSRNNLHIYQGDDNAVVETSRQLSNPLQTEVVYIPGEKHCHSCGQKVFAIEEVRTNDRFYHRRCFRCRTCNRILDMTRFSAHAGEPYCTPHHKQAMLTKSKSYTRSH
ncbi:hypothetical protein P879_02985 [Paragonimus westermani]|uniref:LIM zinc-binding domain-containing protein n=1 Tax=Paragonimus westermani TaxID=34504 RepID=A0A8T0DW89_9TREM|nr:hypothetical protein P879_02985 [Paragonimus westermani]